MASTERSTFAMSQLQDVLTPGTVALHISSMFWNVGSLTMLEMSAEEQCF